MGFIDRELTRERQLRLQLERRVEVLKESLANAKREVAPRSFVFAPSVAGERLKAAREEVSALKAAAEAQEKKRLTREAKLQDAVLEARQSAIWAKGAQKVSAGRSGDLGR